MLEPPSRTSTKSQGYNGITEYTDQRAPVYIVVTMPAVGKALSKGVPSLPTLELTLVRNRFRCLWYPYMLSSSSVAGIANTRRSHHRLLAVERDALSTGLLTVGSEHMAAAIVPSVAVLVR